MGAKLKMSKRFQTFEEFWPYYMSQHQDPWCRALHYAGTGLALGCTAAGIVTACPLFLLAVPIVGYAPAWVGHFFLENNRPATFHYPLYSLRGDFRMAYRALRGTLRADIDKARRYDAGEEEALDETSPHAFAP